MLSRNCVIRELRIIQSGIAFSHYQLLAKIVMGFFWSPFLVILFFCSHAFLYLSSPSIAIVIFAVCHLQHNARLLQ